MHRWWNKPQGPFFSLLVDSDVLKENTEIWTTLIALYKQRRCFPFHHLSAWGEKKKQKNYISPRFQTKQPRGTWASLAQPHRVPSKKRKMTLNHIKEKHLSLQGPSSHVTLNRFMLTKRRMSPEEPLKNWGVGWGICWVDSYQVRALITFPTCAGIQRSVLVGFALFKLHHATFSVPLWTPQWMTAFWGASKAPAVSWYRHEHLMRWFIRAGATAWGDFEWSVICEVQNSRDTWRRVMCVVKVLQLKQFIIFFSFHEQTLDRNKGSWCEVNIIS